MKNLLWGFLLIFVTACKGNAQLADDSYDLYLLIGQSNMAGRGIIEPEDTVTHERVYVLDKNDSLVIATEPLHYDKKNRGTGPGLEFGKTMAEYYPKSKIALIPAAVGGTKISYWEPGNERGLYEEAIRKAKVAMEHGVLKGIVWQQGESDSHHLEDVEKYEDELISLLTSFRSELGAEDVPIVIGGLGDFLKSKYSSDLNETLKKVSGTIANGGYSEASKLGHIGDNLHFNASAQRENGRNMAEAMIAIHSEL